MSFEDPAGLSLLAWAKLCRRTPLSLQRIVERGSTLKAAVSNAISINTVATFTAWPLCRRNIRKLKAVRRKTVQGSYARTEDDGRNGIDSGFKNGIRLELAPGIKEDPP